MTEQLKQLKRCPFCGSKAEYTSIDKEFVRCSRGLKCPSEAAVFCVEDWQFRPIEKDFLEALEQIIDITDNSRFISSDAKFKIISVVAKKVFNKYK